MKIYVTRCGKTYARNAFNKKRPPHERFLSFVNKTAGCWNWTGALKENGYGAFAGYNRNGYAHRFSYTHFRGPIPEGLTIDHLCRNRSCVNPDHLEAVSLRTNSLRGNSPSAQCARKTECPRGHPYDKTNTYYRKGRRQCRICRMEYGRKWRTLNPDYGREWRRTRKTLIHGMTLGPKK